MSKFQFLTPEWVVAAKEIRKKFEDDAPTPAHNIRMNQIITDVPFSDDPINAFMDTTSGKMVLDLGELDDPELTVTTDYETAKAIIVDGNPQAAMQAFMAGQVKVVGDMSKMMAIQAGAQDPTAIKIAAAIQEITE